MLRDIQKNEFPGRVVRLIAPDPTTGGITARELPPYDSNKEKPAGGDGNKK
ncbi:MAG: hypothetical protein ACD_75C02152G0001 [uncultured bacterium]|nr:MAG: hypothetical protein ACD_75C02152G0001 [uncultured bacterium]